MATGRADEAVRPSQPFQVVEAVRISREPSLKLPKGPRVVDAGEGSLHPSSIRLSPVKRIAKTLLYAATMRSRRDPPRILMSAWTHCRSHPFLRRKQHV